jgi:colanic acid biosynthesis glycosyl transferase WcaI
VALYPSHDGSGLRRSINYLSFGLSAATIGNLLVKKPDLIYAFNLVTLSLPSTILRARFRCPVVFDIQDLWPDSVADSRMLNSRFLLDILGRWSSWAYGSATHLVTLSPGMKDEIVRRGIAESNVSVVYNWCNEEQIKPMARDKSLAAQYGLDSRFVVMFAGTMGKGQRLDVLLDAAQRLASTEPRICLAFVGGGIECDRLRRTALGNQLANVIFIDKQPAENMARILGLADVAVVHLKDSPVFRIAIPSKIQAYMAAGKPIVAGIRGDGEAIIKESGAGVVVAPEQPQAIAAAILDLYRMPARERAQMGMMGLEYYKSRLSIKAGVDSMEEIFMKCIERPRMIGRRKAALN